MAKRLGGKLEAINKLNEDIKILNRELTTVGLNLVIDGTLDDLKEKVKEAAELIIDYLGNGAHASWQSLDFKDEENKKKLTDLIYKTQDGDGNNIFHHIMAHCDELGDEVKVKYLRLDHYISHFLPFQEDTGIKTIRKNNTGITPVVLYLAFATENSQYRAEANCTREPDATEQFQIEAPSSGVKAEQARITFKFNVTTEAEATAGNAIDKLSYTKPTEDGRKKVFVVQSLAIDDISKGDTLRKPIFVLEERDDTDTVTRQLVNKKELFMSLVGQAVHNSFDSAIQDGFEDQRKAFANLAQDDINTIVHNTLIFAQGKGKVGSGSDGGKDIENVFLANLLANNNSYNTADLNLYAKKFADFACFFSAELQDLAKKSGFYEKCGNVGARSKSWAADDTCLKHCFSSISTQKVDLGLIAREAAASTLGRSVVGGGVERRCSHDGVGPQRAGSLDIVQDQALPRRTSLSGDAVRSHSGPGSTGSLSLDQAPSPITAPKDNTTRLNRNPVLKI